MAQTHRFSMSSETASAATSFSEKSVSASLNDDGAASTRALAGSLANYKMDSVSGVVSVEDTISGSFEELAAGPVKRSDFSTNRRRTNLDRQTSDTESAGSCVGGNEDCVSVDRVRFDDNVSFIEASSSPVSVGSAGSRASEKNSENSQLATDSVQNLSLSLGVSKFSGASTSSGERKTPKPSNSSSFTKADLSGLEISVDNKSLDVIIEPSNVIRSPDVSIPIEVDQPCNLEVSTL